MIDENYRHSEERLLRAMVRSINRVKPKLDAWLGEEHANSLIRDSLLEYRALIPRIPFIGSRNPLLVFFHPTTRYLAVYRAIKRHDLNIEDAGYLT